ncbi:hypothetical protein KIPB_005747, partial [Kipferlia bialata]
SLYTVLHCNEEVVASRLLSLDSRIVLGGLISNMATKGYGHFPVKCPLYVLFLHRLLEIGARVIALLPEGERGDHKAVLRDVALKGFYGRQIVEKGGKFSYKETKVTTRDVPGIAVSERFSLLSVWAMSLALLAVEGVYEVQHWSLAECSVPIDAMHQLVQPVMQNVAEDDSDSGVALIDPYQSLCDSLTDVVKKVHQESPSSDRNSKFSHWDLFLKLLSVLGCYLSLHLQPGRRVLESLRVTDAGPTLSTVHQLLFPSSQKNRIQLFHKGTPVARVTLLQYISDDLDGRDRAYMEFLGDCLRGPLANYAPALEDLMYCARECLQPFVVIGALLHLPTPSEAIDEICRGHADRYLSADWNTFSGWILDEDLTEVTKTGMAETQSLPETGVMVLIPGLRIRQKVLRKTVIGLLGPIQSDSGEGILLRQQSGGMGRKGVGHSVLGSIVGPQTQANRVTGHYTSTHSGSSDHPMDKGSRQAPRLSRGSASERPKAGDRVDTMQRLRIGGKVRRGPDWCSYDQDGGHEGIGFLVARDPRLQAVAVHWPHSGERHSYFAGCCGK